MHICIYIYVYAYNNTSDQVKFSHGSEKIHKIHNFSIKHILFSCLYIHIHNVPGNVFIEIHIIPKVQFCSFFFQPHHKEHIIILCLHYTNMHNIMLILVLILVLILIQMLRYDNINFDFFISFSQYAASFRSHKYKPKCTTIYIYIMYDLVFF